MFLILFRFRTLRDSLCSPSCTTWSTSGGFSIYNNGYVFYAVAVFVYFLKIPFRLIAPSYLMLRIWLVISLLVPMFNLIGLIFIALNFVSTVNPTIIIILNLTALCLEAVIHIFEIPMEYIAYRELVEEKLGNHGDSELRSRNPYAQN
jgi:hypothetical protein